MKKYDYSEQQEITSRFRIYTIIGAVITLFLAIEIITLSVDAFSGLIWQMVYVSNILQSPVGFFILVIGTFVIYLVSGLTTKFLSPTDNKFETVLCLIASITINVLCMALIMLLMWLFSWCGGQPIWSEFCLFI